MELALIAIDGLDPREIYDLRDELSTIDHILNNSMHGKWRTPGHTIPSFTATLTGKQYEELNFHWDNDDGGFQRHRQTGYSFIWEDIDNSMALLNLPVLYPPEEIDDAMVCGMLTPDSVAKYNLALPDKVQEFLNDIDYTHEIPADDTYEEYGAEGMFEILEDMMEDRIKVLSWLINEYNSDLFYGVWTSPDRWFHECQKHDLNHRKMYWEVDDTLGHIIKHLPNNIPVVFFSDHGFAHYPNDSSAHKGHRYEGWYAVYNGPVPSYRDDSASIFDLYPTVTNYLSGSVPKDVNGRLLFHTEEQDQDVEDRLDSLGYLE